MIWGGATASPGVLASEGCSVWSVWVGVPSSKRLLRARRRSSVAISPPLTPQN